jgi:hypothetical protein
MATVVYTPAFQHQEWVDNVDRVSAGGTNGFNVRFNSIEAEFQAVSQAVQTIDTVLSSLGKVVTAPITIGMTPVLLPFGSNPPWSAIFWSRISGGQPLGTFVEKPTATDQAWGVMPLSLPDGVKLTQLKVLGEQSGAGDVTTDLFQESRSDPFTRAILVTVTGLAGTATAPVAIPGTPVFNTAANLYYLLTRVQNAAGSTVRLRGYQLTYEPEG